MKLASYQMDFREILFLGILIKICVGNSSLVRLGQSNGHITGWPTYIYDYSG